MLPSITVVERRFSPFAHSHHQNITQFLDAVPPYEVFVFALHWDLARSQRDHALALRYKPAVRNRHQRRETIESRVALHNRSLESYGITLNNSRNQTKQPVDLFLLRAKDAPSRARNVWPPKT